MPKITKTEFDSLYSDNITKKEYDRIIELINFRFSEICNKILKKGARGWFDYANCGYESDHAEGHFDPTKYKEFTEIGGEYISLPAPYDSLGVCGYSFPTRWFWEDFEVEFTTKVAEAKAEKILKDQKIQKKMEEFRQKRAEFNKNKPAMKNQIKSKLTEEELKYITFK